MMKDLILATSNAGKIAELKTLLSPIHTIPQQFLGIEDIAETGQSFIENAIIKARHASKLGQKPALADDSGLVVPVLNGQPGIYSARFAGEKARARDNQSLLLEKLQNIPAEKREAFFYCAIVVVHYSDDPMPLLATGRVSGVISREPHGEKGFGYDPVFYLPEYRCTMAQLPTQTKNEISHRALALKNLLELIKQQL